MILFILKDFIVTIIFSHLLTYRGFMHPAVESSSASLRNAPVPVMNENENTASNDLFSVSAFKTWEKIHDFMKRYNLSWSDEAKLVVFVPSSHAEKIRETIGMFGGGVIGDYAHCSFTTKGCGRWQEKENGKIPPYNPYVVEEERIETVVAIRLLEKLIEELKKIHPYKEMGYDIYPLYVRFKAAL